MSGLKLFFNWTWTIVRFNDCRGGGYFASDKRYMLSLCVFDVEWKMFETDWTVNSRFSFSMASTGQIQNLDSCCIIFRIAIQRTENVNFQSFSKWKRSTCNYLIRWPTSIHFTQWFTTSFCHIHLPEIHLALVWFVIDHGAGHFFLVRMAAAFLALSNGNFKSMEININ